ARRYISTKSTPYDMYPASCDRQVRRARAPLVLLRELVCGRRRPHQSVSRFECCGHPSILILEAPASVLSLGPVLPDRRSCPSAARSAARALPAARAPQPATRPPRRRAWLRIFVVRCGLPCDPPVGVIDAMGDDTTLPSRGQ